MAGRKRHTLEQIIRKLRHGDELAATGADVEEIARQLDVSVPTLYNWRKQYGGMKATTPKSSKNSRTRTPCSRSSSPKPNSKRLHSRRLLGENSEPDRQTKRRDDAPGNDGALTAFRKSSGNRDPPNEKRLRETPRTIRMPICGSGCETGLKRMPARGFVGRGRTCVPWAG